MLAHRGRGAPRSPAAISPSMIVSCSFAGRRPRPAVVEQDHQAGHRLEPGSLRCGRGFPASAASIT